MASIFQRIFKVAQSEAHATMDKFEDPIKMSEQAVRDLKKSLQASMVSLAQVKSLAISLQKQADDQKKMAAGYERKAMLLLKRMQGGEMEEAEAERLATAALSKKEEALQRAATLSVDQQAQQQMADQLQAKVEELKRQVGKFENEVITLRAKCPRTSRTDSASCAWVK